MESSKKTSFWTSIIVGSLTTISSIVGSNIQGFTWLLYVCGITLAVSFLVLIWDRVIGSKLKHYYFKLRAMRHLKSYFPSYCKIISKFRILEEIEGALSFDKVEWNNCRPQLFSSTQNSLTALQQNLENMPAEYRLIASNVVLREILRPFDAWLTTCDQILKNGQAKYKTEDARSRVLFLLGKYREYTSAHDELCEEINSKLSHRNLSLAGAYCQPHGFDWRNANPQA